MLGGFQPEMALEGGEHISEDPNMYLFVNLVKPVKLDTVAVVPGWCPARR